MSAKRSASTHKEATTDASGGNQESTDSSDSGSGTRRGVTYALCEIDHESLPEEGYWAEVRRRINAYQRGLDGWRDGTIETSLDDYRGEQP